ncbi:MAG: amidohydrolase family protein [Pseudomonadota bacterium]
MRNNCARKMLGGMLVGFVCLGCATQGPDVDIRIVNGTVIDGTKTGGDANRILDIVGDTIVYIGPMREGTVRQTIDASGMVVAPGFIDPHTHTFGDLSEPDLAVNAAYLFQGVSTVFVGNDGGDGRYAEIEQRLNSHSIGTNVGVFVGHGSIRRQVLGNNNRPPTNAELRAMQNAVAQDMQAGAFGLSTGLFYAPGSFAELAEVVALAKVAARYGGIYESHIRDESNYSIGLLGAIEEAIEVGRQAGLPVHIAHLKALGPSVHGQSKEIVRLVEAARAEGLKVTADQYPWLASGTRFSNALIPRRIMTDGVHGLRRKLERPELVTSIQSEMLENLARRGGADALLITGNSEHQGKTLDEVAAQLTTTPTAAAIDIVKAGDPAVASFMMDADDVRHLMVQEWVVTSSDGSRGHPRKFASFPQKYARYVQSEGLVDLVTFVYRSSGATAGILNICDRGLLRTGYKADVVIFSPESYQPQATYEKPEELAEGVAYLMVNGDLAIREGRLDSPIAGRVLNRKTCG